MLQDILEQTKRRTVEFVEPAHDKKAECNFYWAAWGALNGSVRNRLLKNWRSLMTDIFGKNFAAHDVGLYITVDEVDPELDEMIELAAVYQAVHS